MEGFYSVLGLSIDISKHSALLQRYETSIATMEDIEQAIQAADAARLAGKYITYKSRFLIPTPFGPTVLAFIDTLLDELNRLRSVLASICWPPAQLSSSSSLHNDLSIAVLLRAVVTLASSDILKLESVFKKLDWVKSSPTNAQVSQSAALLDTLHHCFSLSESSVFLARLVMRCRQAFVGSMLSELSYGGYLTPPTDNVLAGNCLFETSVTPAEDLVSVAKASLPAFLVNINVPLLCCADLLSMLLKRRSNQSHKRIPFHSDNTGLSEESVSSSTHIEEDSLSDGLTLEVDSDPASLITEEEANIFVSQNVPNHPGSSDPLPLLYDVSNTITTFQNEVLPALFKNSVWPLADVERVRNLLVIINGRLSNSLTIERERICSRLSLLFLQSEATNNFIHATTRLVEYTMETIELSSHSTLTTMLSKGGQRYDTIGDNLFTESWFKIRVPLAFISHMHTIIMRRGLPRHCSESDSSSSPALLERFFRKKLRKIHKRVMLAAKNNDLLRGDYVLLEPLDSITLLVFGAIHFHIIEEAFTAERTEYFLGEHSHTRVADLSYICRLSQFTNTSLNCVLHMMSRLEKQLGKQEFKRYRVHTSHTDNSELTTESLEEQAQRESFLAMRTMRSTRISPPFPGITRVLNLMARFVISHNTYFHGVCLEPLRAGGLLGGNTSGNLAILLKEAHTRGIITHSIKTLISDMLCLCLRTCYIVSLFCKLSVSFAKNGRLFTYVLQDCRELELRFSGMWETLLKDLSLIEQSRGIDTSCSMLMTWLPELRLSSSWSPSINHPKTRPNDMTGVQVELTDHRLDLLKDPTKITDTEDLSNLRLGVALGLRKPN
ncbi:Hypothetical protein GLP15_3324 [Giardia lamblia P15]|uniref:Uncharacterized protein n=1 Tax=Giardia intestinalis (strain P15) TaxID=658858 RepID=E1F9C7_GIAIA|nr:Hypothetical protein GLP15_3324 [Giardia lamblia P15]